MAMTTRHSRAQEGHSIIIDLNMNVQCAVSIFKFATMQRKSRSKSANESLFCERSVCLESHESACIHHTHIYETKERNLKRSQTRAHKKWFQLLIKCRVNVQRLYI